MSNATTFRVSASNRTQVIRHGPIDCRAIGNLVEVCRSYESGQSLVKIANSVRRRQYNVDVGNVDLNATLCVSYFCAPVRVLRKALLEGVSMSAGKIVLAVTFVLSGLMFSVALHDLQAAPLQQAAAQVDVCTWKDCKSGAASYSQDDSANVTGVYSCRAPLEAAGLRGTFYTMVPVPNRGWRLLAPPVMKSARIWPITI